MVNGMGQNSASLNAIGNTIGSLNNNSYVNIQSLKGMMHKDESLDSFS